MDPSGHANLIPAPEIAAGTELDLNRDYTIIVDKSGSMSGKRWREAEEAVKLIAPRVCEFDADGISLYFFSSNVVEFQNVKSGEDVMRLFKENKPGGTTNLSKALEEAVMPDNWITTKSGKHKRKPETILVVTDGEPDNKIHVEKVIIDAANALGDDNELSITLIQVGDDKDAAVWLKKLDEELQSGHSTAGTARIDIVDTLRINDLKVMHFHDLVRRSIYD